jgi:hypothetical protein
MIDRRNGEVQSAGLSNHADSAFEQKNMLTKKPIN